MSFDPFLLACLAGSVYLCACAWRHTGTFGPGHLALRLAVVWGALAVLAWYTEGGGTALLLGGAAGGAALLARANRRRPLWWNGQHERIDQA